MSTQYVSAAPAAGLRPYVNVYTGYREEVEGRLLRRDFGGSHTVLILGWGAGVSISDPRGGSRWTGSSLIAGPFDSYVVSEAAGVSHAVQLMLSPVGARLLYGIPLNELANRTVGLDELGEGWLMTLLWRLADATDWPQRFAILDEVLLARLAGAPALDPHLVGAWQQLSACGGRLRVSDLAGELGLNRHVLTRRFQHELGLSPKTAARLLRFDAAYARRARAETEGWATIAAECGYFDQAHLNADFRQLTGATPVTVAAQPTMSTDI